MTNDEPRARPEPWPRCPPEDLPAPPVNSSDVLTKEEREFVEAQRIKHGQGIWTQVVFRLVAEVERLRKVEAAPTKLVDQINGAPQPLRDYVYELDTRADPAGTVRDLFLAKEETVFLRARNEALNRVGLMLANWEREHPHDCQPPRSGANGRPITGCYFCDLMADLAACTESQQTGSAARGATDFKETAVPIDKATLDNWFTYHAPQPGQQEVYEKLREAGKRFAEQIVLLTPSGADQTAAIRKVREAVFTANAAVACGGR